MSAPTVHDIIKQRDHARESYRTVCAERDQLRQLCLIAAHCIRYLPLRPEDSDREIIERLEAASRGDKDVARGPAQRPPEPSRRLRAPASQAEAPAPSVQRDLHAPPAPDPGESGGAAKEVTLTAVEKKVLKALTATGGADYGSLVVLTNLPRHRVISAVHTLARFELAERTDLGWKRT